MRILSLLALALICVACGVATGPLPCPDFHACVQMLGQLNDQLSECEYQRREPICPDTRECGIPWGRIFAEVGLATAFVVAASIVVEHVKLKMQERKRYTSMTTPSGGLMTSLGAFGRTTAQRLR
ncbi:hypothetical protein AAVH_09684 [Aphelenchoides avenae]|nr:hypothetical protein AAVH_09684 [Aphelenchus avenae]